MNLLISVLVNPNVINEFTEQNWELLVRQARAANLLGRLKYLFDKNQIKKKEGANFYWHFESAFRHAERLKKNALREIDELVKGLVEINVTPIFLKGAAYQVAELKCSNGRLMSDIDLLVKKNELSIVQSHLTIESWKITTIEDYDEQYYRKWMHEIPPLIHTFRKTTLDVHHNILPLTNKNVIDPNKLNYQTIRHEWCNKVTTLNPIDSIIHSAVHLFTESEFPNGLRDLSDLDMLIREFSCQDCDFINKLINRANELKLSNYINLALRYTQLILHTPIENTQNKLDSTNLNNSLAIMFWDFCFKKIFLPHHSSTNTISFRVSKFVLYWRGHLLRMPLRLLIPHLAKKSYMQLRDTIFHKSEKQNSL